MPKRQLKRPTKGMSFPGGGCAGNGERGKGWTSEKVNSRGIHEAGGCHFLVSGVAPSKSSVNGIRPKVAHPSIHPSISPSVHRSLSSSRVLRIVRSLFCGTSSISSLLYVSSSWALELYLYINILGAVSAHCLSLSP